MITDDIPMNKTYDPKTIETRWNTLWEQQGYAKPHGDQAPYCIMLPPPNVTGTLHMGHGFQHTLMDVLIRRQIMLGSRTLWQGGTDHAGIATQMVVERQLAQEGKTRHDLGREEFLKRVWQWREQSGGIVTKQMRRLGLSIDWSRERFTMDPQITRATLQAFVTLYEEGLIYRGKKLVNWDSQLQTAVSDLEVETEQTNGSLWYIRYPLAQGHGEIVVATTRPETLFGDVAIAVNPSDERYKKLIGQTVKLPLTERTIPIIGDDAIDATFGTGAVKVTPAHDFNDYEIGQRHKLPLINIFTPTIELNDAVPKIYQGLKRDAARQQVIADLTAANLLVKTEPHQLSVPRGERTNVVIEPLLTDQWFLRMQDLAKPAIDAVKTGALKFIPEQWQKTYSLWLENIQDWCLSRQLWWGHQLPVWYDAENKIYVGLDEADARKRNNLGKEIVLRQETDVLDTWFSASLWPFATLGWPDKTPEFAQFYPTNVLITGFDIIFFWVARMVMMSLKLTGQLPFKEVYITGLIRDRHGKKMSKSKGNILDPLDLIDGIELSELIQKRTYGLMQPKMAEQIKKATEQEFPEGIPACGTDALRFTFCALANTGRDINFDFERAQGYRNFCNKIWNAARFVLMNTEGQDLDRSKPIEYSLADQWIQTRCQQTISKINNYFNQYRFDLIAQTLYEFFWNDYCDWYVELAKCDLNAADQSEAQKRGTRINLLSILETFLRLAHPLLPFITEEIWQTVAKSLDINTVSIMERHYPNNTDYSSHPDAEQKLEWVKEFITVVRTMRSEVNISPSRTITVILKNSTATDQKLLTATEAYWRTLAKIDTFTIDDHYQASGTTCTQLFKNIEIYIPLEGLVDKSAEIARLTKEIAKLQKEVEKSQQKTWQCKLYQQSTCAGR